MGAKPIGKLIARCQILARYAALAILSTYVWLLASPLAWAAKKKAAEEAVPEKGYTMSYFIVIVFVSLGLMAICRPSRRADKPPEQKVKQEEE